MVWNISKAEVGESKHHHHHHHKENNSILRIESPLVSKYEVSGWLIWKGVDDEFYYHDMFPHLNMCWDITLLATDGNTVRFERDEQGKVHGLAVDGLTYGFAYEKESGLAHSNLRGQSEDAKGNSISWRHLETARLGRF